MREFDLTARPWILVRRLDGRVEDVSLEELFASAHQTATVVGEVPTQTFALLRLALAVLHRAVDGPADSREWAALWRAATLSAAAVADYLGAFRQRFDLLHPTTPFYQVADLHTAKEEEFGLERLIADVPTGAPLFTTRLKAGVNKVSFAEAARWLVHCQAFDPSGIKSGAVGDPRVKRGKGYPIGTGWAGSLGGIVVEGRTLRETLLLNLIPDDSPYVRRSDGDVPVWERAPQTACEEVAGGREPRGRLDLYTWQSRRVRLYADHDGVTGVLVANGDPLKPHNRFGLEPMSAWRRSRPQEKALKTTPVYLPREHDPERAIWRGLAALLPGGHGQHGKEPAEVLPPAVLRWIGQAQYAGDLGDDRLVRTCAIGMRYGKQQSTTEEIVDDAVDVSVVLLAEGSRELAATAVTAAGDAERGARAYGHLATNLANAEGDRSDQKRRVLKEQLAREQAYAALDAPFRSWLAQLGAGSDPLEALRRWHLTARSVLLGLGGELVTQAGPVAWVGRQFGPPEHRRHVSSPEADLWFRAQIRKAYPLAYEPERAGVQS